MLRTTATVLATAAVTASAQFLHPAVEEIARYYQYNNTGLTSIGDFDSVGRDIYFVGYFGADDGRSHGVYRTNVNDPDDTFFPIATQQSAGLWRFYEVAANDNGRVVYSGKAFNGADTLLYRDGGALVETDPPMDYMNYPRLTGAHVTFLGYDVGGTLFEPMWNAPIDGGEATLVNGGWRAAHAHDMGSGSVCVATSRANGLRAVVSSLDATPDPMENVVLADDANWTPGTAQSSGFGGFAGGVVFGAYQKSGGTTVAQGLFRCGLDGSGVMPLVTSGDNLATIDTYNFAATSTHLYFKTRYPPYKLYRVSVNNPEPELIYDGVGNSIVFDRNSMSGGVPVFLVVGASGGSGTLYAIDGGDPPCNLADLAAPFGVLDLSDIDAFILAFGAGDDAADIAPPFGVLDLTDIDAFILDFFAGCP